MARLDKRLLVGGVVAVFCVAAILMSTGTAQMHAGPPELRDFASPTLDDEPVTRYEYAVIMSKFVQTVRTGLLRTERPPAHLPHGYWDVPEDHWATEGIQILVSEGLLPQGDDAPFDGNAPVTRFSLAVALDKFIQNIEVHFIRSPREKSVNLEKIRGREGDGSQAAMVRLATRNFLPFGTPIFEGPEDTIHPETMAAVFLQAAERIAYVMREKDTQMRTLPDWAQH